MQVGNMFQDFKKNNELYIELENYYYILYNITCASTGTANLNLRNKYDDCCIEICLDWYLTFVISLL